jgi:hypothetical protein
MESLRRNLAERNLSEGIIQKRLFQPTGICLSEGIFMKIFSAKLESFRMESFRNNHSDSNLSEGIFQKKSFRTTL